MGEYLHAKVIHIIRAVKCAEIHLGSRTADLYMGTILKVNTVKGFDYISVVYMLADIIGISLDTYGLNRPVHILKEHRLHQPQSTYNNCRKAQKVEKELLP